MIEMDSNLRSDGWATDLHYASLKLKSKLEKSRPLVEKLEFFIALLATFLSPMNFLRNDAAYVTLSDALMTLSLLLLLLTGRLNLRGIGPASTVWWIAGLSMLLLSLLLSSLVNGDPVRGIIYVLQYFFAYFLVFLFFAGRTERQLNRLAKIYVLSIVLMCVHGIYLVYFDGERNTTFVSGSGRLTGFVERENECAALIAMSVPLLLLLCASRRMKKLGYLALPLMGFGVMLTGSNSGLASLVYAIAAFCLVAFGWRKLFLIGVVAMVGISATDYWARDYLPAAFQRRVLGALETGDIGQAGSFDHRYELIQEAIERADTIVFLGIGADKYHSSRFADQPVHNLYLLLWTEGGLACMVGFIIMIGAGLGPALSAFRYRAGRYFAACTFSILTLFLFSTNAFTHVYGRFWVAPILLAIGLTHAFNQAAERGRSNSHAHRFGPFRT